VIGLGVSKVVILIVFDVPHQPCIYIIYIQGDRGTKCVLENVQMTRETKSQSHGPDTSRETNYYLLVILHSYRHLTRETFMCPKVVSH
jgi:hypothetical protein